MEELDDIVDFYLNTETNYALMITGAWGAGKTYYFRNTLKKRIETTSTYDDKQKKYKPLLVSLFGLKSIEEIQSEIFLSIYPLLKNKTVKLSASIGKSLIKGIMQLHSLGKYDDYVADFDKSDWINLGELVICFDDLERISKNLNIEEFIGYINTLVENENVKVLIIANENKIIKDDYFALKEKVVGNSIEFIPNLSISYDSLIEVRFKNFADYKKFLINNKNFILNVFAQNSKNLRILSFSLTYFKQVFSQITKVISTHSILKEKQNEVLLKLLKFSLAISIEYKKGKVSFTKKENLDSDYKIDFSKLYLGSSHINKKKEEEKKNKKEYRELFLEQYYSDDSFKYFESVYVFFTGGGIFKVNDLIQELKEYYHIEGNKVLPQYEVYNKLKYPEVFSFSDKEYRQLTKELLAYTDSGSYELLNCLSIFHFASRFENPLRYNLEKLEKRIINGMRKSKGNFKHINSLDVFLRIDSNSLHKDRLRRIKNVALDLNKQIKIENEIADSQRLEDLCFKNFDAFLAEVQPRENRYSYTSIFHSFNTHKFYLFFLKSNNKLRWEIISFMGNRYSNSLIGEFKSEMEFLVKLKGKVEKKIMALSKYGITKFLFSEFDRVLQQAIIDLNKNQNGS